MPDDTFARQFRGASQAILALFALATISITVLDYNIYTQMFGLSESQMELLYWLFAALAVESLYSFYKNGGGC